MLFGGTYDWNGRGINDIEPSPTVTSLTPHYDSIDLRDYMYYRTRWGLSGSSDYRLNSGSSLFVRGFYSTFRNWGQKWVYTLNDGDVPKASIDWRRPDYAVGNLVAGGRHTVRNELAELGRVRVPLADAAVRRQRRRELQMERRDIQIARTTPPRPPNVYAPAFSASCFTPGPTNTQDISNYTLSKWNPASVGQSAQLNLQASASYGQDLSLRASNSEHSSSAGKFETATSTTIRTRRRTR